MVCDVCDVAIVDNVQRKQSLAGMQLVHGRQSSFFFSLGTEQKSSVHHHYCITKTSGAFK